MKQNIIKIALAVTVIVGAFGIRAKAKAAAASCLAAENVCYVVTGPDGDHLAKAGVLVYPASN
ncbi:hypothetical protein [Pedobacter rhodius]|uniref:Uncharacterized protein n=1 Tax=Pedobacter rhodius TaxID=3004098 RepID=A0ABT4KVG1_9SPHI|nr:hypothetical protein [Pedobacter sp. SJ11]MCZ4222919.1 hypothetical protein [Pedobacter sp. SJ11]